MGTDKLCRHDIDVRSRSAQLAVSPSLRVYTLPRVSCLLTKQLLIPLHIIEPSATVDPIIYESVRIRITWLAVMTTRSFYMLMLECTDFSDY